MIARFFSWVVFFAVVGAFVYVFQVQMRAGVREIFRLALPCTLPVSYRIGSIDPRFGISTSTLENDLSVASTLWNVGLGKELFVYDPNGSLTVNLVYDSRQEMTKRLHQLGVILKNDRASYEALKQKYDATYAAYQAKKSQFESDLSSFNSSRDAYQQSVDYWNGKGGAPKQEYDELQAQSQALAARSARLKTEQDSLNARASDVNDLARAMNQLIASLNLDVQKYNTTGSQNGDSFEQGVYERQMGVETITIFEYENNALLTRVLAHELGHSIGLSHVEDSEAIMYYLNQGDDIALSQADKNELTKVCRL